MKSVNKNIWLSESVLFQKKRLFIKAPSYKGKCDGCSFFNSKGYVHCGRMLDKEIRCFEEKVLYKKINHIIALINEEIL